MPQVPQKGCADTLPVLRGIGTENSAQISGKADVMRIREICRAGGIIHLMQNSLERSLVIKSTLRVEWQGESVIIFRVHK
ncbi:MAG: hypothetical protein ACYYK0_05245 [Candidatus Eutrophobiaceae bacterium]